MKMLIHIALSFNNQNMEGTLFIKNNATHIYKNEQSFPPSFHRKYSLNQKHSGQLYQSERSLTQKNWVYLVTDPSVTEMHCFH